MAVMAESTQWSCDIHTTLPLRIGKEGYAAASPITVGELFRKIRDSYPDNVALSWKDGDEWKKMTYFEYYNECVRAAKSFLKVSDLYVCLSVCMLIVSQSQLMYLILYFDLQLGLESMHAVTIIGFNSPEWVIADLGTIFAG